MKSTTGSIELNYRIDGEPGLPWLIFSNSVATDMNLWTEQVTPLMDRFQILRYDQRGHGLSDAPEGRYTIDILSEDLLRLMDSLNIVSARLVGISMGAMTVLTFAKQHPDRTDKLVVCDCGPSASPASAQQWLERIDKVLAGGMDAIVEETVGRWFTQATLASMNPVVEKVSSMIKATPVPGFVGSAYALSTFDLRADLETLKVPTLFIAGEQDAVIGGTRSLSDTVPNSEFKSISGAGHLCNLENPHDFLSAIMEFL
ncbi:MAG: alpha/beta fold hydrolase [Acidimicrobiaceae bacterium]|nr:alpha/beta fold hydrolase [Acidimicrobiaceae bacterium]